MPHRVSQLRRNLRFSTLDGIAAMPVVFLLTPGNFVLAALLTTLYQLPPGTYGFIVSLPFWCNFAQIGVSSLLARQFSAKALAVGSAAAQTVIFAALAVALHWLPPTEPSKTSPWFFVFFLALGITVALSGIGWTTWVDQWVPVTLRETYFGIRNRLLQVSTVAFLVVVGVVLDGLHYSVFAFQVLLLGSILLRAFSTYFQQQTHTDQTDQRSGPTIPWREQLAELRRSRAFVWLVLYGAVWGFAANCFGAFYPVFMYQPLGLTVSNVSWFLILTGIGAGLSYPAWGALANRYGNKPVMIFCMIAWQLQFFGWCFLTRQNSWLLHGFWAYAGLMSAGHILGLFNLLLKVIPPRSKVLAISINLAVTSLVTAIAPMLGGWFLESLLRSGMDPLVAYHRLFLIQPVVAILGCTLLWRVHEPAASPLVSVVGAMRNIRTLAGIFGLSFLVNFVFVKNRSR